MTYARKAVPFAAVLALFAMVAAFGLATWGASGADHLDAPGLTSPGGEAQLDINDLYVFEGSDPDNTVLALTVNSAATGDTSFASFREGSYHIRIDNNGDAVEDITYSLTFLNRIVSDGQFMFVRRATGEAAQADRPRGALIGFGVTDRTQNLRRGGGMVFAGLRSDPFFFDLGGFLGTVEGSGDRMFNDDNVSDFFAELNTLGIVIEVPDVQLGGNIGVWATTSVRDGRSSSQLDRIGRAAINTVVNSSGPIVGAPVEAKNVYNAGKPSDDVADFLGAAATALKAYSSLDSEGAYTDDQLGQLLAVVPLLPDLVTYDTSSAAAGPLNGRALADDVIDIELTIVTGGDPLEVVDGLDEVGAINGDGIGPHDDYTATFPYLGVPHS